MSINVINHPLNFEMYPIQYTKRMDEIEEEADDGEIEIKKLVMEINNYNRLIADLYSKRLKAKELTKLSQLLNSFTDLGIPVFDAYKEKIEHYKLKIAELEKQISVLHNRIDNQD